MWLKDKTHNLVVRLRHNVIRAGLYRISLAYWRISLADVAAKLGWPLPAPLRGTAWHCCAPCLPCRVLQHLQPRYARAASSCTGKDRAV